MIKRIHLLLIPALCLGLSLAGCNLFNNPTKDLKKLGFNVTQEEFKTQIREGNEQAVSLFLEAGMDPNLMQQGDQLGSAIFHAIFRNRTELVKLLLESGADPNLPNNDTNTPLIVLAREQDNVEIFNLLIEAGADINKTNSSGGTPIMYALNRNFTDLSLAMLAMKPDLTKVTTEGYNALILGAAMNNAPVIDAVLNDETQNVNAPNQNGTSMFLVACAAKPKAEVLTILLKHGGDVTAKDSNGTSCLMSLAQQGNLKNIQAVLDAGADINARNQVGRTALFYAIDSRNIETVEMMIQAGADLQLKDNYQTTVLIKAAQMNLPKLVELFVEKGLDVQAKDSQGMSALDYANSLKYSEVQTVLISANQK